MRQTNATTRFSPLALIGALLLLCLVPAMAGAQGTAFQDLPRDHWAYKDVDFLIKSGYMDGYPDGTFKGRKVITRYDMALVLARILRQIEGKKASENEATETERAALSRLTKEFKDELGLLGVRVDGLERRMNDAEAKMASLEDALPKVRVSGFIRGRGQYIIDPKTVYRDEAGDEIDSANMYTKPGLQTFYQQMYLRFTGKPLGERIETFYELVGFVSGKTWNKLIYNDVGKSYGSNPFDSIDDYVTKVQNDRYAQTNKIHLISNAKSMKVRVFAGEAITGIDDPLNTLTEDTDVTEPYQGIEFSGTDRGLNYQASVLKSDLKYGYSDTKEIISGRMVWKLPNKFSPDSFSVGTTFAEKVADYKIPGNSNTVRGADINYTTERIGKVQATAEFLTSTDYHADTSDNGKKKSLGDEATKMDISVQNGGFTGTVKHYDFGKEFRARLAPIWAYDIGDEDDESDYPDEPVFKDNYGHEGFYGEKLTRFSANYDFGNKLLSIAKNLSMETTYLTKTWEVDPFAPQKTDGYSGRKFTYQLLSDFTDSTTLKYDFEQHYDALPDEAGKIKNTIELDLKLNDSVSSKGKVYVATDADEKDVVGDTTYKKNDRTGYFEINSNINPRVFAKGSVEHQVEWANAPKENTRIDYIGETTYNLTPNTSLTGGVQHIDFEHKAEPGKSSLANAILAELKKNFTEKFRGRAFYTRGVIDYKDGKTDTLDRENIYGELIYDISKDASVKLKFGYDYPDKWRWDVTSTDNGRDFEAYQTQKMLTFEAKANF
ncbi:MAG TPA: S-layer homology domain-containing protein [Candidatus Ozemobacteraceae bacterium]